jgi:PPM family protein phosphatase
MQMPSASTATLVRNADTAEPIVVTLESGTIVAYSMRSPDREPGAPNEDAGAIIPTAHGAVIAVADGLGGLPGGQLASGLAVEVLSREVSAHADTDQGVRDAVMTGLERANHAVQAGIGQTTMIVAEIAGRSVRTYNVGDSAALIVGQRGKLKLRTVAHSPVGYGVAAGLINEKDALHHEHLHYVSNTLGGIEAMRIEVSSEHELAARDTLVLGTDGLFDNLHVDEIVDVVRKGALHEVARELAEHCSQRMKKPAEGMPCKPDDLTFVLYRAGRSATARSDAPVRASTGATEDRC